MNNFISQIFKQTAAVAVTLSMVLGMTAGVNAQAASTSTTAVTFPDSKSDCDDNAVMYCGAKTSADLVKKYNESTSTQVIFNYFGISKAEVDANASRAVAGYVTKDGRVYAGEKQVANSAVTAGRQNMTGSTRVVSQNVTFYTRTPSVSFSQDRLDAYVILNANGQFEHAIIVACGNPVKATNIIPTPAPKPTPAPVAPVQAPAPVPTPAPVAAPAPAATPVVVAQPVAAPAPAKLVAAGPASAAALFVGTSVAAAAGHALFTRRRS